MLSDGDFYGGAGGGIFGGSDLEASASAAVTLSGSAGLGADVSAGANTGPAFAWVGFVLCLIGLRVLIEVSGDVD